MGKPLPKVIRLTKETNEIQRLITLKNNRNKRFKYQEFVLEGHAAIDEAFKRGWKIKALFYDSDKELTSWAKHHLENEKYEVAYAISSELMEVISDKSDKSELIAIAETKIRSFTAYHPKASDVLVVLDEPKSPGNMGMMIRSAAAFGVSGIVISGHGADEYDPKCILASVGTFFSMPIYRVEGISSFCRHIESIKESYSVKIAASGDKGSDGLQEADFSADVLFLVLGNETTGVSMGYKEVANQFLKIELPGPFTSLNVAAAGSIFLYEIFQRHAKK